MIPLSLTIKGLYSYQEQQTIDFSPLLSTGLFGIFGNVGSGKSAILEAITFALYGETERMNARENRNYNMMNLKSNELLIDFRFRNYDEKEYRFVVKGKRSGKRFSEVGTYERKGYEKVNGEWIPISSNDAENITGLSYQNFRRTIIIPQGKFQEFLQLKETERTRMLSELFSLEKYEFHSQTKTLEHVNNEKINKIEGQLERLSDITPENILALQNSSNELSQQLEEAKTKLMELESSEKSMAELGLKFSKLDSDKKKRDELLMQKSGYQLLQDQIDDFEYCATNFRDKIIRKKESEKEINLLKSQLQASESHFGDTQKKAIEISDSFERINEEMKKQEERKSMLHDHKLIHQIRENSDSISYEQTRLLKGKKIIEDEIANQERLNQKIRQLKNDLLSLKQNQPDIVELSSIQTWFVQRDHLSGERAGLAEQIQKNQDDYSGLCLEVQKIVAGRMHINFIDNNGTKDRGEILAGFENIKTEVHHKTDALDEEIKQLRVHNELSRFSEQIADGRPCPLCGSVHHPDILILEDVREKLAIAVQSQHTRKEELQVIDQIVLKLNKYFTVMESLHADLALLTDKLAGTDKKITTHANAFLWEKYKNDSLETIVPLIENIQNSKRQIMALESEQNTTEEKLDGVLKNIRKYEEALQSIEKSIAVKEAQNKLLTGQLQVISLEKIKTTADYEPSALISRLEALIAETEASFRSVSQQKEDINKDVSIVSERIKLQAAQLEKAEGLYTEILTSLTDAILKSRFHTVEAIETVLGSDLNTTELKSRITLYNQQLYKAEHDVADMELLLQGQSFDPEAFAALVQRVKEAKHHLQAINNQQVRVHTALSQMISDLTEKERLENDLHTLKLRGDNLRVLLNLFKASGFVNYISTIYLQNLCLAANERFFKLTKQQLSLEMNEDNEFIVRDYLNEGKTRSVKTLSGGQTFQASLSLALALADSIHSQNKAAQNFFFLDEGFGSLDKDSLEVVFETLQSLRSESRIVGIISHVEDLKQEIDVSINIVNTFENGSRIEYSF